MEESLAEKIRKAKPGDVVRHPIKEQNQNITIQVRKNPHKYTASIIIIIDMDVLDFDVTTDGSPESDFAYFKQFLKEKLNKILEQL